MGARLSPETEDEIVGMYVMAGKSGVEISRFIGCDLTTVYHVLARNGIEIRPRGRLAISEVDEAAVLLEYEEVRAGRMPRQDLLTRNAISDTMLSAILHKNGVPTMNDQFKLLAAKREEAVVTAYQQGWAVTKIAAAFEVTLPTIYKWLAKAGVQLRRAKTAEQLDTRLQELVRMLEVERNILIGKTAAVEAPVTGGVPEQDAVLEQKSSETRGDI